MKKLYILLYVFLIVLMSGLVSAATDWDLMHLYQAEQNGIDSGLQSNPMIVGAANTFSADQKDGNYSIVMSASSTSYLQNTTMTNMSGVRSFGYWYKPTSCAADGMSWAIHDGTNYFRAYDAGADCSPTWSLTGGWTMQQTAISLNKWHFIVAVIGTGGAELWVDNNLTSNHTSENVFTDSYDDMVIGNWQAPNEAYGVRGNIDGAFLSGKRWTADMIDEAWNSGNGLNYTYLVLVPSENVQVQLLTPESGSISNYVNDVYYNITSVNSSIANCNLWTNFTGTWVLNQTNTTPVINNTNNSFNINSFSNFGSYKWNVNCSDVDGNSDIGNIDYTFTNELNYSYGFISDVLELSYQKLNFTINTTGLTSTDAALYYDGTIQTLTKTSYTDYDFYNINLLTPSGNNTIVQVDWIYNVTGNGGLSLQNVSLNQTINGIYIDNCAIYQTEAINFSMRRDDTNALMDSTLKGYFKIWVNSISQFRTFNLTWGTGKNHSICIYPNTGSYNVYAQMEYETATADFESVKTYYLTNATLNNQTEQINLYLTANTTDVTFSVSDENDDAVQEVYINILKYDIATNSHTTNSIIKTDSNGEAIGAIKLTTQWYKFILIKNGEVIYESEPVKITSTTRNFRVTLEQDYFSHYEVANNITTGLTFTNSTGNFAFTWANPTGIAKNACLKVIRRSIYDDSLIGETCQNAASGTILINVGDKSDYTFLATGTISGSPLLLTDVLEVSFNEGYKKWGKDGIFMSFFVRLAFALMGIWNPIVAIILLILADIGMIAMGLYSMSWTTIMIYIILAIITIMKVGKK